MTRFSDDGDWDYGRYMLWETAQARALSGKRGQQALRDLEQALIELPEPKLISGRLAENGQVCAALSTTQVYLRKVDRNAAMERVRTLSWASVRVPELEEELMTEIAGKRFTSSGVMGAGGFEPPLNVAGVVATPGPQRTGSTTDDGGQAVVTVPCPRMDGQAS